MDSQCYQCSKVLYNIEKEKIELSLKNIDSLIALLNIDNTIDFTSFSLLSKDKMFHQRLSVNFTLIGYPKYCKS